LSEVVFSGVGGDPVESLTVENRVGVGGLGEAVGVLGAVGGAIGQDEDSLGGDFFEEGVEGEGVETAGALAPD
jgi:hypothetical protein